MLSKDINKIINKYITFNKAYIQELKESILQLKNDIDITNNKKGYYYNGYFWKIKYSCFKTKFNDKWEYRFRLVGY